MPRGRTKSEADLEADYKVELKKTLRRMFPGIVILINDPTYQQGIPDFTLLYMDKWAALEVKAFEGASIRPNQPYYIDMFNSMSYAAFIYPENEEEILRDLQFALQPSRNARASFR